MGLVLLAPEKNDTALQNAQAFSGAMLIATGLLMISKERLFPGGWAVLPIAGTVLIISAGSQAWLNRTILANRVMVWFGLISFPLYLWHWPLLSFARIIHSETPSRGLRMAIVAISIGLAWLTYILIERPIRCWRLQRKGPGSSPYLIRSQICVTNNKGFVYPIATDGFCIAIQTTFQIMRPE